MSAILEGIPAAPGVAIGPAYAFRLKEPSVPHVTIPPDLVEVEIERFRGALGWAKARIAELRAQTERRLGSIEAKIFDPQLAMLDDPLLVDGTLAYIRDSYLTAARAFNLRVLEIRSQWLDSTHAMLVDRIADLTDTQLLVLSRILDLPDPDLLRNPPDHPVVVVAHELTPSITVRLDRRVVLGFVTAGGARTSHASILARALGIPAVVGVGDGIERIPPGEEVIVDGGRGRVVLQPGVAERRKYEERERRIRAWEAELRDLAHVEPVSEDGTRIELLANIDLPSEAVAAAAAGADGIGLLRTEFLVVGKSSIPEEDEQYEAFRAVAQTMGARPVTVRTYDLGGDKFPLFLEMPREENPFLGWRAIRVTLDMPELFRKQLRAILRASAYGRIQICLPMVNSVDEVLATRRLLDESKIELHREGKVFDDACALGVMIETPAAAATAELLARHVDFFSIGTNDLIQYALAVDRGNARLARYYDPYHPGVLRLIRQTIEVADAAAIPVTVCGEMASDVLSAYLLLGLGLRSLSVNPNALTEIKKLVRSVRVADAEAAARRAVAAESGDAARAIVVDALGKAVDLSLFTADEGVA
ncbi:MAG: phosphoenolpyruvate--protein phosphotransferase [Gemmatimonadota bacterium]